MQNWKIDFLDFMSNLKTENDIDVRLRYICNYFEFDNYAFGVKFNALFNQKNIKIINSYSCEWNSIYTINNYIEIDPVVDFCSREVVPILWRNLYSDKSIFFWNHAKEFSLNYGISQGFFDNRFNNSILSFSRKKKEINNSEFRSKFMEIHWVSQMTNISLTKFFNKDLDADCQILTPRELEVMRWTADGKTSFEISRILNITERTVNFHISNCLLKLNTANKVSAVVKAIFLGFLF
ncbi:LuxR C-terminal-related transcriptional regulator [Acinetobacter pittii]|uniref:autoinducer binding domain-containing protein n=1 Tax=Acinetobacter pittii TaxID=48296 RepID=UPI0034CE860C